MSDYCCDAAEHVLSLCQLALETSDALRLRPGSISGADGVKAWLLAQACTPEFLQAYADRIVSHPAAKALVQSPQQLLPFHLRTDADSVCTKAHNWPVETWSACLALVQPCSDHNPQHFLSGDAAMTRHNECSHFVELDAALRRDLPAAIAERLSNVPLVLYAMQSASDARLDSVCEACAACLECGHAEAATMKRLTRELYREHVEVDADECARQYAAVLQHVSVAQQVTCDRSAWPAPEPAAAELLVGEACASPPYQHATAVRSTCSTALDHPADVCAKAFAQQVGFSPVHSIHDQRFLYVTAGMRNHQQLFTNLFSDEQEHTQQAYSQYSLSNRDAPLHDEVVFPHLLGAVLEQQRPDRHMDRDIGLLMREVNGFLHTLYAGEMPAEEQLPRPRRIGMWLAANSRGDAATRLSQWFGVSGSAHNTHLDTYLRKCTGPSPQAMQALRSVYFTGLDDDDAGGASAATGGSA